VQPVGNREHEHAIHLFRCQRLRPSSCSTGWHIGELDHVPLHQIACHRPPHRSVEASVHASQSRRAQRLRQLDQPSIDFPRGQVAQLAGPKQRDHVFAAEYSILLHRGCSLAAEPVGQPVFDRLAHGVVVTAEGESVLVVAQLLTEFALRFGLGPARSGLDDPLAPSVIPDRHSRDPALALLVPVKPALAV
jgi:hypothetical protein